jgi:transcriptional regulator
MHTYPRYAPPSQAAVVHLVREHPFAVLVSAVAGQAPAATHVPIVLPPDADPDASLEGVEMLGHMGRANPHGRDFDGPTQVLMVFASSHGYVSPQVYDYSPAAPTLDYAAVHLTGTLERIDDRAGTLGVVEATVAALESLRPTQWDPSTSREYFERIAPGVVAFRILITRQQAMFKLSQDKTESVRDNVRRDFVDGPHPHPDLVNWIDRFRSEP